jgi:hypothetical protein
MKRVSSITKSILLSCLVTAVSVLAPGQQAGKNGSLPDNAGKLKEALIKQDTQMHDALPRGFDASGDWADDYSEINEAGELLSKAEVIARYKATANRRPNIPPEDYAIRIYPDTIVMTHVLKKKGMKKDEGGYLSVPTIFAFRVSHVFVKRQEQWQMVLTHWTPVTEPRAE